MTLVCVRVCVLVQFRLQLRIVPNRCVQFRMCGESDSTINHKESHTKCTKQYKKIAHSRFLASSIFLVVSISAFFCNRFAIRCRQKVWMHTKNDDEYRRTKIVKWHMEFCQHVPKCWTHFVQSAWMKNSLSMRTHTHAVNSTLSLWMWLWSVCVCECTYQK